MDQCPSGQGLSGRSCIRQRLRVQYDGHIAKSNKDITIFYYERVGVVFDYAHIVFELQMYAQKRNICADLALELYIVTTLIY